MTQLLVQSSLDLPLVSMSVSLPNGSILDPEGKEGLLELTLRLMRRNAKGRRAEENDLIMDGMGGSLGAHTSVATGGLSGAVIARRLPEFVRLVRETLIEPSFKEDELDRLKRETVADLVDSLDNDRSLVRRWFRRKFYQGHAYGRSAGGTKSSIESITLAEVQSLYGRLFAEPDLLFAFAGDVQAETAESAAREICRGTARQQETMLSPPAPAIPQGRRLVFVDKPERTQTQILIGCMGTHPRDEDHIPLVVANTIFGGTFTARLTQEVRAKRGWSYGAHSSLPFDRARRAFSMWTFPKASDAPACVALQLALLEDWHQRGVTKKELGWAKRYLQRSDAFSRDTAAKRVSLSLDTLVYNLPASYYPDLAKNVAAVTQAQANDAVAKRISADDLWIVVVGTKSELLNPLSDAIANLQHVEVVPYDDLG